MIHLTLLHSERPKLYTILAFLSAIGLTLRPNIKKPVFSEMKLYLQLRASVFIFLGKYLAISAFPETGDTFNPTAFRKAKIVYNFGLSQCNRVNTQAKH